MTDTEKKINQYMADVVKGKYSDTVNWLFAFIMATITLAENEVE